MVSPICLVPRNVQSGFVIFCRCLAFGISSLAVIFISIQNEPFKLRPGSNSLSAPGSSFLTSTRERYVAQNFSTFKWDYTNKWQISTIFSLSVNVKGIFFSLNGIVWSIYEGPASNLLHTGPSWAVSYKKSDLFHLWLLNYTFKQQEKDLFIHLCWSPHTHSSK